MLIAVATLQIVVLLAVVALLYRKPPAAEPDARLGEVAEQLNRLDEYVRDVLAQMRKDSSDEAGRTRKENSESSAELRKEVTGNIATLGQGLKDDLKTFRDDNLAASAALRTEVEQKMRSISQGFSDFKEETASRHSELKQSLSEGLVGLMGSNNAHQEKLRDTVEERLTKLNTDNAAKLEEMRKTVDEKLHETLQSRFTESFGAVSDQLIKVHTGLGEMTSLTSSVNDLSRMFSNVSRRGGMGEAILGQLIGQILAPAQFRHKVNVNPQTREVVEYAVCIPAATGETLLPIDSKWPREDWDRLRSALEAGVAKDIAAAGKAFESAIRTQAKLISSTYINEPFTTPHAIMFLPTESLYAEVISRNGLQDDIQQNCHVTIAGPSTLSAILISFKMGFQMLNLQQKGNDVWKILASTRTEFNKFGKLMDSVEKQVGTVQNTIHNLGVRTRVINRTLGDASDADTSLENILEFGGVARQLAAATTDEE
jgi:DNA recombination protein RmuC